MSEASEADQRKSFSFFFPRFPYIAVMLFIVELVTVNDQNWRRFETATACTGSATAVAKVCSNITEVKPVLIPINIQTAVDTLIRSGSLLPQFISRNQLKFDVETLFPPRNNAASHKYCTCSHSNHCFQNAIYDRDLIAHTSGQHFDSDAKLPDETALELPSAYDGLVGEMGACIVSATTPQAIEITKIVVSALARISF